MRVERTLLPITYRFDVISQFLNITTVFFQRSCVYPNCKISKIFSFSRDSNLPVLHIILQLKKPAIFVGNKSRSFRIYTNCNIYPPGKVFSTMSILYILFHLAFLFPNAYATGREYYPASGKIATDTLLRPQKLYSDATYLSQYLFNGARYHVYDRTAPTHQFYVGRDLLTGTIRYDGYDYGPYQMLYDIYLGQLIIKQPVNGFLVQLDSAKVEHFTLNNSSFERVTNRSGLKSGIYQTLYEGKIKLICRRKKIRLEKYEDSKAIPVYVDISSYFLYKGEEYRQIKRKKDIYSLFPEHRKEIRSYLRSASTSFKEDIEPHLLEIAKIIDQPGSGI